jgi:hypothetical protein
MGAQDQIRMNDEWQDFIDPPHCIRAAFLIECASAPTPGRRREHDCCRTKYIMKEVK